MKEIFLIRHGISEEAVKGLAQKKESELAELGVEQIERLYREYLKKYLQQNTIYIITSPIKRAYQSSLVLRDVWQKDNFFISNFEGDEGGHKLNLNQSVDVESLGTESLGTENLKILVDERLTNISHSEVIFKAKDLEKRFQETLDKVQVEEVSSKILFVSHRRTIILLMVYLLYKKIDVNLFNHFYDRITLKNAGAIHLVKEEMSFKIYDIFNLS